MADTALVRSSCYAAAAAAAKAAGAELSEADLTAAFREARKMRDKLVASGDIDDIATKLADAATRRAEQTRIAAALQKRHAALNVLARDRLNETTKAFKAAGFTPKKALLAVMEGSQQGVAGARNSVAARKLAYEARYVGGMMAEIQKDRPHLINLLANRKLSDDVFREMGELRDGGKPGLTGNDDAKYLAGVMSKYAELSRTDLNKLGGSIGKLDGWAGPQVHNDLKMMQAGKETWVNSIAPLLDYTKSFPDADSIAEVKAILSDTYDTLITGIPNVPTGKEKGQRVNPANLAKRLGKSRVLHFKDADAAISYRDAFGYGDSIYGIMAHQRKAAGIAAQMEVFGPNPELMFNSAVETERRAIRDSTTMKPEDKKKALDGLSSDAGSLRGAFEVMSGAISRPGNVRGAKIGANIRAAESMAKLGGAVLTAMPTDIVGAASASMFRGSGFFDGMVRQVSGIVQGRPKAQQAEISFMFGEGFDSLIGDVMSHGLANDGPMGKVAKATETFFKWSGLNWWTDVGRSVVGRTVAAEMGMRAETAFGDLPSNYAHVLGLHGIDETRWDAIRQAGTMESNGNRYITPDAIRDLDDGAIEGLAQDRLDALRSSLKVDEAKTEKARDERKAKFEERRADILDDTRRDLELTLLRFVADETNYAIVETDAASRRVATLGTRPGTIAGEATRFVMQFKGFPIAFSQRVLGRAAFGGQGANKWERAMNNKAHVGALLGGLTVAGYMSMTMKDLAKGYWPPRDPTDPKVMIAALTQGGALGIYGDFLFGEANRFGAGPVETLSGPAVGTIGEMWNIYGKARAGDPKAGDYLNLILNNTPWVNLAYARPAADFLFLNSLRNWFSPGAIHRQRTRRADDYGQRSIMPENSLIRIDR